MFQLSPFPLVRSRGTVLRPGRARHAASAGAFRARSNLSFLSARFSFGVKRSCRLLAALLFAISCWAAELDFSHQLHLTRVGVACTTCHASVQTSSQATDRNLPSPTTCLACHDGSIAPAIDTTALAAKQTAERSYRFNHQFHLGIGNTAPLLAAAIDSGSYLGKAGGIRRHLDSANECQACHRGLEETALSSPANLPQMSDCLVCHTKVNVPFSCATCHLETAQLKPADHTPEFADLHSSGKLGLDKQTCLPCHGRKFTCMGCH